MTLDEKTGSLSASSHENLAEKLSTPRAEAIMLMLMVLAGFMLRYLARPPYQVIAADGPSYVNIGRQIMDAFNFQGSIHYPPFYPFLIGLANMITHDQETAGMLVSLVMGSLLVVPVFLLGKAFFGRGAGYAAAAITLVWPEFVGQSNNVLAYSTYFTMLMTGLYFLWVGYDRIKIIPACLGGAFVAAAYLTRQEAFISMAAVCFTLGVATWYKERSFARIKPLLAACATLFILIFPYILMVHEVMGIWTLAGKSVVTLTDCLSYYLGRPDLNRDPTFGRTSYMDLVTKYPGYFPFIIRKNFSELINILPLPVVVLTVAGFTAGLKKERAWASRAFVAGALAPIVVLLAIFLVSSAYIAPYMPFLFIMCGNALVCGEDYLRSKLPAYPSGFHWLTLLLTFAYALNMGYHQIPRTAPPPYAIEMDGGRYDQKLLGKLLKKELPQGSVIMTRSGRIGFYSGLSWVDIPQADLETILRTAREKKVRYLVVEGQQVVMRPQLGVLLLPLMMPGAGGVEYYNDSEEVLPGIVRKLRYLDPASQGVVVYEFRR